MTSNRRLVAFAMLVFAMEATVFVAPLGRDLTPFILVLIPAAAALIVSAGAEAPRWFGA